MEHSKLPLGIPTEITEALLDNLDGDQSSLKPCALVCCAWLDSTRPRLFHNAPSPTRRRPERLQPSLHQAQRSRRTSDTSTSTPVRTATTGSTSRMWRACLLLSRRSARFQSRTSHLTPRAVATLSP
ncbi:hypothetical protein K466DRAFT_325020 [Polyporus arcularius HHB13444]|uniref:F-box domain-containing protein n=1 Tax=Polyporus arcularius HHB13444 TaxID=1314778 RepID=A0A5C3Q096_9APHY|nr:hypothetical protein K466DRAFT_325020 [Polyporus arcularius HHB13444]